MSRVEVDLDAFRANVRALAATAAPAATMIAVKADAYGHGLLPMSRAAVEAGATWLGVLEVDAALDARGGGIEVPLFAWLHGEHTAFGLAIRADVDLGVSSLRELRRVGEAAASVGRPAAVHLKIDTGLHRNGANPEDWPALVTEALALRDAGQVRLAGIWSHLADASPTDDAVALGAFRAAVDAAAELGVPTEGPDRPLLHLAASSAGIRMPEARFDLVRFGIAAYGSSPFDDQSARELGMRAPMTVVATVVAASDGVATLDLGSADGIPPNASPHAEVLLAGRRAAVLEVGIDTMRVASDTGEGAEAVVFGPGDSGEPTVEQWAAWAGTIGDEILVNASRRIPRLYRGA